VCGHLIGVNELLDDDDPSSHAVILGFWVSILESTDPDARDDAAEARWVDLGDVTEYRLAPGLAEFLHDHGVITTIT